MTALEPSKSITRTIRRRSTPSANKEENMNISLNETLARDIIAELEDADFRTPENLRLCDELRNLLRKKSNSQTHNGLQKATTSVLKRSAKSNTTAIDKCLEEDGKYYVTDNHMVIEMNDNVLGLELGEHEFKLAKFFEDFLSNERTIDFYLEDIDEWLAKAKKEKMKAVYFNANNGYFYDCQMIKDCMLATQGSCAIGMVKSQFLKFNGDSTKAIMCAGKIFGEEPPKEEGYCLIRK